MFVDLLSAHLYSLNFFPHDKKEQRKYFYASMTEALIPHTTISDFDSNDLTPQLENYVNNKDGIELSPDEVPEVH